MPYHLCFITKKSGFTLIELLIAIGIITVLAAIAAPIYGNWQAATGAKTAVNEIKAALELAQADSVSGLDDSAHGVYLDINESGADSYTIFSGSSYTTRDTSHDDRRELDSALVLATDIENAQVDFSQGRALPSAVGTVTLTDKRTGQVYTTTINELGVVEISNEK